MQRFIKIFMTSARQSTMRLNEQQMGLYAGLILEEVAELLESLGMAAQADELHDLGNQFKKGAFTNIFEHKHGALPEMLDAAMDIAWVSYGFAFSMGANVDLAEDELVNSNMSKLTEAVFDSNNKLQKGKNYVKPNFLRCIPLLEAEYAAHNDMNDEKSS